MRVRTGVTGLMAAACASVLLAPSPAAAAQAPGAGPDSYCVKNIETDRTTCYDTFRESIAAATGGRITDAPAPEKAAADKRFLAKLNAPSRALANAGTAASAGADSRAANSVLHALVYEHAHYEGRVIAIVSDGPCKNNGKWDNEVASLGSDWDNQISSLIPANNCYVELFSDPYFQGARQLYTSSTPYVGSAMNDQASSLGLT
ncbi:peptidase inhibitor family I36 protein [Streptomyces sp. NPDC020141]|uniref:peptidase inhibitor family I36 protein n=1 Tax=Streptomyces sp. NPDC020141 TaxID=3365065 RepID=UPI0037AEDAC1